MNERHRYILLKAYWEGFTSRNDLMNKFGIASTQATKDFTHVKKHYKSSISYDLSIKKYVASKRINTFIDDRSFDEYIALETPSDIFQVKPNLNQMPLDTFRSIHTAILKKMSVSFAYISLQSPDKQEPRIVHPHSLFSAGPKWYLRAWERKSNLFKDYNLSRIQGEITAFETQDEIFTKEKDTRWNTLVDVLLIPNPGLSKEKKKIIEIELDMNGGILHVKCRAALLLYTLNSYLVTDFNKTPNEHQLLAIANVDGLLKYLSN